jgi:hypothetical protein
VSPGRRCVGATWPTPQSTAPLANCPQHGSCKTLSPSPVVWPARGSISHRPPGLARLISQCAEQIYWQTENGHHAVLFTQHRARRPSRRRNPVGNGAPTPISLHHAALSGALTVPKRFPNLIKTTTCPFDYRPAVVVKRRFGAGHAHLRKATGPIIKTSLLTALAIARVDHNLGRGVFDGGRAWH